MNSFCFVTVSNLRACTDWPGALGTDRHTDRRRGRRSAARPGGEEGGAVSSCCLQHAAIRRSMPLAPDSHAAPAVARLAPLRRQCLLAGTAGHTGVGAATQREHGAGHVGGGVAHGCRVLHGERAGCVDSTHRL